MVDKHLNLIHVISQMAINCIVVRLVVCRLHAYAAVNDRFGHCFNLVKERAATVVIIRMLFVLFLCLLPLPC